MTGIGFEVLHLNYIAFIRLKFEVHPFNGALSAKADLFPLGVIWFDLNKVYNILKHC